MVIQRTPTKIDKIVSLRIGQHQENVATQIKMDVSDWITVHPTAGFHILFKRPGEVQAQPVLSSLEEGILTWTVQEWETSLIGVGYAEVRAIEAESALVAKSRVIPCSVEESVIEDGDVPPEYSGWVERILNVADLADDLEQSIADGIEDIQAKGTEVLDSIPADYTTLSDDVTDLKSAVFKEITENLTSQHIATLNENSGYYINVNVGVGNDVSLTPIAGTTANGYAIYDCKNGDIFSITGKGGNASRLWAFVDANNKLVSLSDGNLIAETPDIATATADGKLICNVTSLTSPMPSLEKKYVIDVINDLQEKVTDTTLSKTGYAADAKKTGDSIDALTHSTDNLTNTVFETVSRDLSASLIKTLNEHVGYYINTNVDAGNEVNLTPILVQSYATGYAIYPCKAGDVFTITGKGGTNSRLWAFVDADNKLVAKSDGNLIQDTPVSIQAQTSGLFIYNTTSFLTPYPSLVAVYTQSRAEMLSDAIQFSLALSPYNKGILDVQSSDFSGWYNGLNESYAGKWDSDGIPTGDGFGYLTTYAHVINKFDALMAMDTDYVSKNNLGIASGRDASNNQYNLFEYVFKQKKYNYSPSTKITPKILFQCCAHGFEKNACYATYYWLYDLVNNWQQNDLLRAIRQNVEIHVIPVLNPYGFDNDQYYNGNGVNINRNYDVPNWTYYPPSDPSNSSGEAPFDQPENRIVKNWLESNLDAFLFIDCHTNGHYYSSGYNEANPLMPITETGDDYYNMIFSCLAHEIGKQTLILPTKYQSLTPDSGSTATSFIGRIQSEPYNLGKGHANLWAVTREKTVSFTLEIFNGLNINGTNVVEYLSPEAKKIGSELVGNVIAELLKCFSSVGIKL